MTSENETQFKAEVKKALALKGWHYADLAKRIGVATNSIAMLMCRQTYGSDELIEKVCDELKIPRYI